MNDPAIAWVRAASHGDEAAARRLVAEYHARLFGFLRRLAGSDAEATELVQRTYCRAWGSLASFEGRCSVSCWLHGIAYRAYVDWLRGGRRFESRTDAWWEQLPASGPAPDAHAVESDAARCVYAAVDQLAEDLRDAVHLHYYQALTLAETATALGVATSTVKYRLREAIARVRQRLGAQSDPVETFRLGSP
jgi:RNA polymerase sigma-70 factor (ECF subfamily)